MVSILRNRICYFTCISQKKKREINPRFLRFRSFWGKDAKGRKKAEKKAEKTGQKTSFSASFIGLFFFGHL
jgi:hypothetical protein